MINIFFRGGGGGGGFPHRSFYERDDKLTSCLIEIKFLDNDHGYVPLVVFFTLPVPFLIHDLLPGLKLD